MCGYYSPVCHTTVGNGLDRSAKQNNPIYSRAGARSRRKQITRKAIRPLSKETPLLGEMLSEAKQRGLPSAASKEGHEVARGFIKKIPVVIKKSPSLF